MSLVLDASVAVKWILDEVGSEQALALRHSNEMLIAPSIIVAEIGNTLWKRVRRQELERSDASTGLEQITAVIDALIPLDELHRRALEIAMQVDHPIYDCFYLALAEREDASLVTADARFLAAAHRLGTIEAHAL